MADSIMRPVNSQKKVTKETDICSANLLVSDDDNDLVSVFFGGYFRAKPFFQRLDRPSDLVSSRSCFYEKDIASLYHKLAVKSPKSCDVRMDVINQAHFKRVFCKKGMNIWSVLGGFKKLSTFWA